MAGTSYPFAGDALSPIEWSQMARLWQRNGVVAGQGSELAVTVSGDAIVGSGALWLNGFIYQSGSVQNVPLIGGATTYINAKVDSNPTSIDFIGESSSAPSNSKEKITLASVSSTGVITDLRTYAGETYLPLILGNGATVIPVGKVKVGVPVPYDVMVKGWNICGDKPGQLSIEIQTATYDSWTSTAGTALFTASVNAGGIKNYGRVNYTIRRGTFVRPNVVSVSTMTQAVLTLALAPILVTGV